MAQDKEDANLASNMWQSQQPDYTKQAQFYQSAQQKQAQPNVFSAAMAGMSDALGLGGEKSAGSISSMFPAPTTGFFGASFGYKPAQTTEDFDMEGGAGFDSETPLANQNALNTAQSAEKSSEKQKNHLEEAMLALQGMQSPRDKIGGIPFLGSEDVKMKYNAYGRPYTVVDTSPTERHSITEGMKGVSPTGMESGPHSWEVPQASEQRLGIDKFKKKKSAGLGFAEDVASGRAG